MTSIDQAASSSRDIQTHKKDIRRIAVQTRRAAKKTETDNLKLKLLNVFCSFASDILPGAFNITNRPLVAAAYMADASEIDPSQILSYLRDTGWQTALPCIEDDASLSFRAWQFGDALAIGKYDMQEPASEAEIVIPDLVIAPLLAFDRQGNRLGRGGGYYDRALKTLRAQGQVLVVGIGFDAQLFEKVPHEQHDEKLDFALTPSGVHEFEAA